MPNKNKKNIKRDKCEINIKEDDTYVEKMSVHCGILTITDDRYELRGGVAYDNIDLKGIYSVQQFYLRQAGWDNISKYMVTQNDYLHTILPEHALSKAHEHIILPDGKEEVFFNALVSAQQDRIKRSFYYRSPPTYLSLLKIHMYNFLFRPEGEMEIRIQQNASRKAIPDNSAKKLADFYLQAKKDCRQWDRSRSKKRQAWKWQEANKEHIGYLGRARAHLEMLPCSFYTGRLPRYFNGIEGDQNSGFANIMVLSLAVVPLFLQFTRRRCLENQRELRKSSLKAALFFTPILLIVSLVLAGKKFEAFMATQVMIGLLMVALPFTVCCTQRTRPSNTFVGRSVGS